jgi:asparagine synthase (glutamine-hydrolysing)
MCGIAGYVLRDGAADLDTVRSMCDQIRHRGPDDEGFYVDGPCAIGMRRLSIIDLATGHQPISNEDGSVWVVFNGEIYNFQGLRRELIERGHRFATNSDTETLIHLYEQSGVEGISRLQGMFAYAIWDGKRRELLLVRDRFGKKPLYYAATPRGLFFASELKCLRVAGVPLDLDREALRLYFEFSYIPDPWSPHRMIRKLEPGCWLRLGSDGGVEQGRYWELPVPSAHPRVQMTKEEACRRVRETFDDAVRSRMIADVPLGAFLSGGIDSSAVVASMALQSKDPVKTFSIGFEEAGFNELPFAAEVARAYKTDHHEIMVRPDSVDLAYRLVRHFDEPFGDSSAIPTFIVSEFAVRHVKVALSGDGGDEIFGGYPRFAEIGRLAPLDRVPQVVRRALSRFADLLPYSTYGKNYLRMITRPDPFERYLEHNYAPYFLLRELLQPEWMPPAEAGFMARILRDGLPAEGTDPLSQALYFEAAVNLPGDMLVKVDRMSMANSLEVRCPLLDHRLAELAAALPNDWKVRNGRGKLILIEALADRFPEGLLDRPKKGFSVPLAKWFRGPLRELAWDHLLGSRFLGRGIVRAPFVRSLLEEHQRGRRDNSHWMWVLLMLELWLRDLESAGGPVVGGSA